MEEGEGQQVQRRQKKVVSCYRRLPMRISNNIPGERVDRTIDLQGQENKNKEERAVYSPLQACTAGLDDEHTGLDAAVDELLCDVADRLPQVKPAHLDLGVAQLRV